MKIADSKQMRNIDREACELYGIPGILLMENAAIKLCRRIVNTGRVDDGSICIVCGKGNNGGDGFAASRHLSSMNKDVILYLAGREDGLKGDARVNFNIARNMGIKIKYVTDEKDIDGLAQDISRCSMVIDGLFGTGIRGDIEGLYKDIISTINTYAPFVVSIDIPSGIDGDTGRVMGAAVRANMTVTFELPKRGLFLYPGAEYCGNVFVEGISIPKDVIERQDIHVNLITREDIKCLFPERRSDTNKGTYGRACIIAGSKNMMGAAAMCGMSALKSGAGLVELDVPECIRPMVAPMVVESIVRGFEDEEGVLSYNCADELIQTLKKASSFAMGPGISKSGSLLKLIERVIEDVKIPGVIDADGLNMLSENIELLHRSKCTMVVTPHPGEMARLIGKDISTVQSDRIGCAREFSTKYKVVTVLKGANTVIGSPEGEIFINSTGNPGMAKGGSGDVLTGMIASFMAQGMEPIDAAVAGVYIHGLSGDIASASLGQYGMKAGDIIECIPQALMDVSGCTGNNN